MTMPAMDSASCRYRHQWRRTAKRFRDNPAAVIAAANLSAVEESILLSRDPKMIQSALHSAALKGSLNAAGATTRSGP